MPCIMAMRQAGRTDILPPTPAGDNTDSTLKAQQKDIFLCHLLEKCVKVPPMEWPAHPLAKVEAGGCSMRQLLQFLIKDNSDMHEEEGETERRVKGTGHFFETLSVGSVPGADHS